MLGPLAGQGYYPPWVNVLSEKAMGRTVAQLNIEHFKKLLAKTNDEAEREKLLRLIAEEEAKLKAAEGRPQKRRANER